MGKYRITAPDGNTYDIEAPEGATEQDVMAYAQKNYKMAGAPKSSQPKQTSDLPFFDRYLHGVRDPIAGGAQLLEKTVNSISPGLVNKINSANNWLADKTGIVARLPEGGVSELEQNIENKYQTSRGSNAGSFDTGRLVGNIINPANVAIAARAPLAASLAGRIAVGGLSGGVSSALNPVYGDDRDYWAEKAKQVGFGSLAGGTIPVLAKGISSVFSPKASTNQQLKALMDEGVKPTIGQTLGGTAARVEEKLQSLPIMGDMIRSARQSANSSFEKAAVNRALKPIGEELPPGLRGNEAIAYTERLLGDRYNAVLNKIGAVIPDNAFNEKVANLTSMVNKLMMPAAEKEKFMQAIGNVAQSMDKKGVMTSDAYKALESSLGADARKLGMSTNIYESKLAPAVKQLQAELREMLGRQAGNESDELAKINSGWANFKRVQNAAGKVGTEGGEFSPAQFQNAVRAMDKSKDKAAFARGNALGQDLSSAGKSILTGKVPNSGTADRLAYGTGAVGAGFINPAIPLGLTAGAAAYTPAVQNFLRFLATTRPSYAPRVASSIEEFGYLGAPVAAGLLQQNR